MVGSEKSIWVEISSDHFYKLTEKHKVYPTTRKTTELLLFVNGDGAAMLKMQYIKDRFVHFRREGLK